MEGREGMTAQIPHRRKYGWQTELATILKKHNERAANRDKVVGYETKQKRADILYAGFEELRQLGYRIENPRNFCEKHMHALAKHWETDGQSPATIQNKISIFRVFAKWIGKDGMIKSSVSYVDIPASTKRDQVARVDKSWSAHDIDFQSLWDKLNAHDPKAGAQLLVIRAFGLRRKEAVTFKPYVAERRGERSHDIVVEFGTKGGRPRSVPIETEDQMHALEYAKTIAVTPLGHIGWDGLTLKQSIWRFSNLMRKFGITKKELGVTAHGLRHEYANDKYERHTGKPTPVRGGKKGQVEEGEDKLARQQTSEALGHSRLSVTASYYGSHRKGSGKPDAA